MYISGLHIDGFGIYHDQGVQDLPLGLVVFAGDNESGKTTLMEFIRTVLFGFRRRGSRNDYPPLRGGGHGGRLALLMSDGRRVVVERTGRNATLTVDHGAPQPGEPGELLLGGIDRSTFEHIFAIGLEELQGLKVLDQEGVRGRLFSASAGLGAASIPGALKAIDEELGELWAPRSKKHIPRLLDRLREVDKELKNLQGQAAAYAAAQSRKEELEASLGKARAEMADVRFRLRRLEQLQQGREPWAVQIAARQKVKELEAVKDFPPFGLARLEQLQKEMEEIRLSLEDLEGESAVLQERLAQVSPDEALLRQRDLIEALLGEREKIASSLTELPYLRARLNRAQEEYQRRLKDLGPDWDAQRLAQVDTSVAVRQEVQEFGRKLDQAERRREQCQIQEEIIIREAEEARRQVQEAGRALAELPALPVRTLEELKDRQETLGLLRGLFHRRELLALQLKDCRQRQEEAEARLSFLKEQMETAYDPIPWWVMVSPPVIALVLDVILSSYGYYLAGNLTLAAGLLAAGLLYLGRRRLVAREKARRSRFEEEAETTEQRLRSLGAELAVLASQATTLEKEIADYSLKVAPEPLLDAAHLEFLAVNLHQAGEQLQSRRVLEAESAKAETRLQGTLGRLQKAREETEQAASELQAVQNAWYDWLRSRGLPESVRPEAFEAVLQAVERAREAEVKVKELSQRLAATENYLEGIRSRIGDLLARCGRPSQSAPSGVEDLDRLRRDLSEALTLESEKRKLELSLNAAQKQAAQLRGRLKEKEEELQNLILQAGARDEEDFRRRAALHQEYLDWLKRLEQSEIALLNIAGNPYALRELQEELSRIDPLALEGEKEELEERLRALEGLISQSDQEVGRIHQKLSEMARDEQLGNLLQEQSVLEEQLKEAVKRWAVLMISRRLVEEARDIYERERQPEVIREASRFLELMVGKGRRLVAVPGEPGLWLEDPELKRRDELRWSAGLADQVYLAVRLGLAREFGRHLEPLPVVLDDVLVRFDQRRRRGAARVILEFARDQQVLLFTCHPEFQDLILRLKEEPHFQETTVACFHLSDGTIHPGTYQPGTAS